MPSQNSNLTESTLPEWLDPFPEPHTMPRGWDLDGILPRLDPPAVEEADGAAETPPVKNQNPLKPHA